MQCGVVAIGLGITLFVLPPVRSLWKSTLLFVEPVLLLLAVLLSAFVREQLMRTSFEANRRLAILQAAEQQKRAETEKMLQALNGAIGGIVHDLGHPLTKVQMGASSLEVFVEDGAGLDTLRLCTGAVTNGARMLNFLRLSLIEQSRVLEGKPTPVDLRPVSVREVAEAGASFQQPRVTHATPSASKTRTSPSAPTR